MKVYLDEILLAVAPTGIAEIEEVIELDLNLHGYVRYFELPLEFIKDGFKYINNAKKQDGFCRKISVRIEVPSDQGTNIARGYLFLTEGSLNHTRKKAKFEITDDTYGVFVSESKSLKISPAATVTRSGEVLTPVTATDITLFAPSTGADLATDAKMFEIADVIEHIIKYLSDNGLQFSQSYFGGTFDFYLSNHYYIYNRGTAPDITLSFEEVMRQCFKLFGTWFKIDNSTTPPTFNLVQGEENFFEAHGGITWSNIRDLVEEFYPERFFSTVDVGDDEAIIERGNTYQLPTVSLVGFKPETFNAGSNCSLNNKLDLKSEWIIDHNRIENIIATGTYDENPLLIYANTSTLNAHKGTYGKDGNMRYYNEEVLNYKVLNRHSIPTTLTQANGADTSGFRAYKTGDTTLTADNTTSPYPFDEDSVQGYDIGGNYNNVTYRYIAPAAGAYKFLVNLEYLVSGIQGVGAGGSVTITIKFNKRKTGTGTILQSVESDIVHISTSTENYVKQRTAEFFLEATDFVDVSIEVDFFLTGAANSVTIFGGYFNPEVEYAGSYFETVYTFNSGGTAELSELLDYKASALKFDGYPIRADHWNSIKQNPSQGIHINNGESGDILSWIKIIRRNIKTGKANVQMLTSSALTQL